MVDPVRRCRTCGCTEGKACLSGCAWVREDLCSECLPLEGPELEVMVDLLMVTASTLSTLPWQAFARAVADPAQHHLFLPQKVTPERRALILKHLQAFADHAAAWRETIVRAQREMQDLGPALTVAAAGDLPKEPPPGLRMVRP